MPHTEKKQNHFAAIYCRNVRCSQKLQKNHQNPFLGGSRSFNVIDVNKSKKPVTSACYNVQPFSRYTR